MAVKKSLRHARFAFADAAHASASSCLKKSMGLGASISRIKPHNMRLQPRRLMVVPADAGCKPRLDGD
jgi:hypothetical protein